MLLSSAALAAMLVVGDAVAAGLSSVAVTSDPTGQLGGVATNGDLTDPTNPFNKALGTNQRRCVTCHVPSQAWSVSAAQVQQRFNNTSGTDPIFRLNDGANSPNADVSTLAARQVAYSMLLYRGVIRVGLPIPATAEFDLQSVDDPYGFASASELSLFRRPLPSTNLVFLSSVMWDGRETLQPLLPTNTPDQNTAALQFDLKDQAKGAILGHEQATRTPTDAQLQQIVDFEIQQISAQISDRTAGSLTANGGQGGPVALASQPFFVGTNDVVVDSSTTPPTVQPPAPAMTLYNTWSAPPRTAGEAAVNRGQTIFNTRPMTISGVDGLNDTLGQPTIQGSCTTCHNTPNVGNHSVAASLDTGVTDAGRRTPDMPLYTLHNKTTGEIRQTTDPGRALITGLWADIGKFKGPVLRGLPARAPYFHDGSAATLDDVVNFYNTRFNLGLSTQEHSDLVAFLRTL